MGDRLTPAISSAAMLRAKFLKATLESGSRPSLSRNPPAVEDSVPAWLDNETEIQKAYLEQLVESAPEAITILDTSYRILRINSEFTRLFG